MVGLPQKLDRDSTIFVVSQLPVDECDEILQAITATKHSFHDNDTIPWLAENRYYTASLQFKLLDSLEDFLHEAGKEDESEVPAFVVVVDASKAVDTELLGRVDSQAIDVPLVVGKGSNSNADLAERNREECLANGFEYIDLNAIDAAELGGQSGLERLSEALQAHMWPNAQMKKRPLPSFKDDEVQTSANATPGKQDVIGFDDDFSPFVSSASSRSVEEEATILSGDDIERDPTDQFSALFSSLSAIRKQAQSMPDDDKRKDFAADVAMRFAKQLDALMGTEEDDLADDVSNLLLQPPTKQ